MGPNWRKPKLEPTLEEKADTEEFVKYWNNSTAIRARIEESQNSSADVVLFLEFIPKTFGKWFEEQIVNGPVAVKVAIAHAEKQLFTVTAFMNSHDMLHFDVHGRNILTDGQQLYFSDFGLATSSTFELSESEIFFLNQQRDYDKAFAAMMIGGESP